MDSDSEKVDPRVERAVFDGVLIATLSYGACLHGKKNFKVLNSGTGALLMLYIQLLRVLLTRPKRGKVFWGITVYSGLLFAFASIAAGGKLKYAEYVYVGSRFDGGSAADSWAPSRIFKEHASMTINVMSRVW